MTPVAGRRCGVLGSPIAHSLSPALHRAAYEHLGLDWSYTAHEVREEGLAPFVAGLDRSWRGLSLTMPLKRVALELADRSSDLALRVGAANTLLLEDDGLVSAENTDVAGIVAAIRERSRRSSRSACVWGGGATAASALAALPDLGVAGVHLHVRDAARAEQATAVAAAVGVDVNTAGWQAGPGCADADLVISTVPAGAADTVAAELGGAAGPARLLFDVVYAPWPTRLAETWARAGGVVVSGLDLLVHQAVGQVALMTGQDVPVEVLRAALRDPLRERGGRP